MSRTHATFVEVLDRRADERTDDLAFRYLADGERAESDLTYGQLARRARAIAGALTAAGATDHNVVLLFPSGLDFIAGLLGCFLARAAAVPAYPPDPTRLARTLPRLRRLVADSRARVVLTSRLIAAAAPALGEDAPELAGLTWIAAESCVDADLWRAPAVTSTTVALIQYTSGSTGDPRGVVLTHGNLLHNQALIQGATGHTRDSVFVGWAPLTHDMGLVGQILQPLFVGAPSTVMSPEHFLQRPSRWLAAITRYRATTSGAPNFAYEQCIRKIGEAERVGLDLSSWQVAFNAAEPVRPDTLERFADLFAGCGLRRGALYPCYGLAEATLLVAGGRAGRLPVVRRFDDGSGSARERVGCGAPLGDLRVVIVDPVALVPAPPGGEGEIWIAGGSVGSGYYGRPEDSAVTFGAHLASGAGPFLRTGDLGRLDEGELFVTGRLKDLIVLHGRNLYPQDVERVAEGSHAAVRRGCTAAFSIDHEGEERLVVAAEVDEAAAGDARLEVARAIRRAVAEQCGAAVHEVALLRPRTIPKTASGKLQRQACRGAYLAGELPVAEGPSRPEAGSAATASAARADELIAWLRDYARTRINSRLIDERRCIPPYIVLDFGNQGLLGMLVPLDQGGLGLRYRDMFRVIEQLAAIDLTLAVFVGLNNTLGVRTILRHAGPRRRAELLPRLASGRELAAFAFTEAGAGSNPWAIRATATSDGRGGFRLRGAKIWSGSSAWAGAINVFAHTLDADGRSRGISAFVVRAGAPGLRLGPEALTMGVRGMVQNTVVLEDVPALADDVLGTIGGGMEVAQDAMRHARLGLGALAIGGVKRCLQLMTRHAARRQVGTGRLLDNPVTLARLGELHAGLRALEALVGQAAEDIDRGQEPPEEAFCVAKIAGPELLGRAADQLVQLLGGRGYIESNLAPQMLRDARLLRIFEGPTETMQMFLGSRVIHAAAPFEAWLAVGRGAPTIAARLRVIAEEGGRRIEGASSSRIADRASRQRWAQYLVGEAAVAAALWAAAERSRRRGEDMDAALAWAEAAFSRAALRLRVGADEEATMPDAQLAVARADALRATIGDVEQELPGADEQLDTLLRVELAGVASEELAPASITAGAPDPRPVIAWMTAWIARHAGLAEAEVDPAEPFASYAIDSVAATQMIAEIEAWLGRPVAATLVWDHPSISRAAEHLCGDATTPSLADEAAADPALAVALARVEALSDEEVAALLGTAAALRRGGA